MRVCVFEDRAVETLQPMTLTRPASELLCGASSLLEHQQRYFGVEEVGLLVRPHLAESTACKQALAQVTHVNDLAWLRAGPAVLVNARWLPPEEAAPDLESVGVATVGKQVAYAVLPAERLTYCSVNTLEDCLELWRQALPQRLAGGAMIDYPWDLVQHNGEMLARDFDRRLRQQERTYPPAGVSIVGPSDRLLVEDSAQVEPMVLVDTTRGPVLIDRDARVQAFSRLEGPCYVGPGTRVLGGRIRAGTTLGPDCRVGGEVEASILHGRVNKYHDGFLGHSYVGEWVNLAAGTHSADLRTDYQPVRVEVQGWKVNTGLTKVGCFLGDHTKTGLGVLLNPGTTIGAFCSLLPSGGYGPRTLPPFCTQREGRPREQDLDALLHAAAKVMSRRGRELSSELEALYRKLHQQSDGERQEAVRRAEQPALRRTA